MPENIRQQADIVVIGGGIAGLWLLNRLCCSGYNTILLEHKALGSDQSVASQGMIHGGIKYTLGGTFTGASEAIAQMPDHWRACLQGEGDVDLRKARVLSDHFYLWSSASVTSRLTAFLASKATRGRVEAVRPRQYPTIFQNPAFKGSVYQLVDMVLDVPSVVRALADNVKDRLFQIDWQQARWQKSPRGNASLIFDSGLTINAPAFVLAAGEGNENLLADLGCSWPQMQRRPLQQVMVRHRYPHSFYGHCLGMDSTPRLTISSHPCGNSSQVWYLGGALAEKGAEKPASEVIAHAQQELAELMPWVGLTDAQWATLPIDRAEPRQRNFARPDKAFAQWAQGCANVIAAWPTKLTLAPNLANEVLGLLGDRGIPASGGVTLLPLEKPPLAPTPWGAAFGENEHGEQLPPLKKGD